MRNKHAEGALVAAVVLLTLFAIVIMNFGGGFQQRSTDAELACAYDSEQNQLTVTVASGTYKDEYTTAIWVLNGNDPATISFGGQTTGSGIWTHDANISDLTNLPIRQGESVTVANVTETTRTTVLWIRQDDNARLVSLDTAGDPVAACSA